MKKLLLVYRLFNPTYGPTGNPKTLTVLLNDDNTLSYVYFGGWQNGGSAFSISNMQLEKSLPMSVRNFANINELHKEIKSILATGVGSNKISSFEILNDL